MYQIACLDYSLAEPDLHEKLYLGIVLSLGWVHMKYNTTTIRLNIHCKDGIAS